MRFYGAWGNADDRYRLVLDLNIIGTPDTETNTTSLQWIYYVESNMSVRYFNAQFDRELTINGVKVHDVLGSFNMQTGGLREVARGTITVPHNSDGTKTVSFSGFGKTTATGYSWSFDRTIADSYTLPTIPRASSPTVQYSSRAVGLSQTIYTNRASTSFTHTLQYRYSGGTWATIATGVGASYAWTIPLSLANNRPNNTSGTVEIRCITYSGGSNIGTKDTTFTFTIPNDATFQPTLVLNALEPVSDRNGYYVQGKSKVNVQMTGTGAYGATISQYKITIDGSNYYGSNITSNVVNKSGTIAITLLVTDSRGYTKSTSTSVTYQEYFSPKINAFSARRNPAQTGTGLYVALDYEIAPIAGQNSKEYVVYYRAIGASSWIELARSSTDYSLNTTHTASGVLDATISYEVRIVVSDDYSTPERTVSSQTTSIYRVLNILADKSGLAIGKFAERPGIFDIALPTHLNDLAAYDEYIYKDGNGDLKGLRTGTKSYSSIKSNNNFAGSDGLMSKEFAFYSGGSSVSQDILQEVSSSGNYVTGIFVEVYLMRAANVYRYHCTTAHANGYGQASNCSVISSSDGDTVSYLSLNWVGGTLSISLNRTYAMCFCRVEVVQRLSTGKGYYEWLI